MPPLEDELRAALQGRAATLTPAADPFAGVEQRARGLRRRRTAASVAGTALAVLAVVGVVPLATSPGGSAPGVVATSAPSAAPTTMPAASPYALDEADPWEYRGIALPQGERDALLAEWQAAHPGASTVTPLFGQVWEPSGRPEVVVVARGGGPARWGVLSGSEAGWTVVHDELLAADTRALVAPLAGDDGERLLVVAAPDSDVLEYTPDASVADPAYRTLPPLAEGVATGAVETATPVDDRVRVRTDAGEVVWIAEVPDRQDEGEPAVPVNVLAWPTRGTVEPDMVLAARRSYASQRRVDEAQVREKVLFAEDQHFLTGSDAEGRRVLLGQFWLDGDTRADTVGFLGSVDDLEVQLKAPLEDTADVVALYVGRTDEQPLGLLVLVPRPGTTLVEYSPDADSPFTPQDPARSQGVVVFDRPDAAERVGTDRVRVLRPARGPATYAVADLLCGTTSCS